MTTAEHREHVTRIFYEEPGEYRIVSFSRRPSVETAVMSVDTEEDAQRVEAMVALMTKPHWHYGVDELVGLLDRLAASAQGHPTS
jgi:spore coat polysaccharide biosynthesis protein SpsF (cytidylyltransferase family)